MEFQVLIQKRKSVHTYTDKPIPQDALDCILKTGNLASTSRNLNPCTFRMIQDGETLRKFLKTKKAAVSAHIFLHLTRSLQSGMM